MGQAEYLALMAACLLITLPLELLLGARVWRRPKRLVLTLLPLVAAYVAWDAAMIARGSWTFDPDSVTGVLLPLDVPLEELVFFVVVPICGLLTLEAVGSCLTALGRLRAGDPLGTVLRDLPHGGAPRPTSPGTAREGAGR